MERNIDDVQIILRESLIKCGSDWRFPSKAVDTALQRLINETKTSRYQFASRASQFGKFASIVNSRSSINLHQRLSRLLSSLFKIIAIAIALNWDHRWSRPRKVKPSKFVSRLTSARSSVIDGNWLYHIFCSVMGNMWSSGINFHMSEILKRWVDSEVENKYKLLPPFLPNTRNSRVSAFSPMRRLVGL